MELKEIDLSELTPEKLQYMLGKLQYMLDWRDKKIEELRRQIAAVDDVIAIAAGYIVLLAGDQAVEGQPIRIDKARLHQRIAEFRGAVRYVDGGDHILIEFADEEELAEANEGEGEGGDADAEETQQEGDC
ncbi:MAG: hypothetical protein ACI3YH_03210 [Eubacteriales bacterium]